MKDYAIGCCDPGGMTGYVQDSKGKPLAFRTVHSAEEAAKHLNALAHAPGRSYQAVDYPQW